MIFINIDRLTQLRGIPKAYTFLKKHGFSHHTAKKLTSGAMMRPDLRHVEKLCRIFHCTPHDLFDYHVPKDLPAGVPDPLAFLSKPKPTSDIRSIILGLPLDQLQAIAEEAQRRATAV